MFWSAVLVVAAVVPPFGCKAFHSPVIVRGDGIVAQNRLSPFALKATKEAIGGDVVTEVKFWTKSAILNRGKAVGYEALHRLQELSDQRLPFSFDENSEQLEGSIISFLPQLIPEATSSLLFQRIDEMVKNGLISTNPDSVDGLPSFHINLISDGKPIVPLKEEDGDEPHEFKENIRALLALVEPHIYNDLLPKVNSLLNTDKIRVADIFLRRYGDDVLDGESRNGISAHYDVFSKVTAVIALDNVAADGRNGLYTCLGPSSPIGASSNHASLRRFFPLKSGDAVVHTWDVLHGVDVQPGLDRASLIVWFTTEDKLQGKEAFISPWLLGRDDGETNDVAQYVLASAVESCSPSSRLESSPKGAMYLPESLPSQKHSSHPHDLYLESARRGNSFALTRLGSLCENDELSCERKTKANEILSVLENNENPVKYVHNWNACKDDNLIRAKRFWYASALRGNPLAQNALAYEIMCQLSSVDGDESGSDARLFAATLFALAAQQGNKEATESLSKVMRQECTARNIETEDDFLNLPVVKVASCIVE